MKFNTGFYANSDVTPHDCTTVRPVVRPDLSFTVKEIAKRFTLQNIILQSQNSNPLYNGDANDNDFDQPAVNVPQMYDLVDARADTMRVLGARKAVSDALKTKQSVQKENNTAESTAQNASSSPNSVSDISTQS